jgi:hypothetical protein
VWQAADRSGTALRSNAKASRFATTGHGRSESIESARSSNYGLGHGQIEVRFVGEKAKRTDAGLALQAKRLPAFSESEIRFLEHRLEVAKSWVESGRKHID